MSRKPIPLARPWTGAEELAELGRVLESGVLSRGQMLTAFEQAFATLCGTRYAVGVNSGTSALQIALEAFGIGDGDEVITVSYTFIGTLNAIVRTGARPVLVDVDPQTLNIDPERAAEAVTQRTRALLVVHLFGRPAPMDRLRELARVHDLRIIEDACEAVGAQSGGRAVGGLGDAGCFGFYPNKPVATGEGGMIVLDDPDAATRCRQLRNQGLDPLTGTRHPDRAGLSARLSELQAALGVVQLARLDASLQARRMLAELYLDALAGLPGLELPAPAGPGDRISWFTFPVRVADCSMRDRLRRHLASDGIETGWYFPAAHQLPPYDRLRPRHELPVTEDIAARCLALPLYPELDEASVRWICSRVRAALGAVTG
ncbi:MAG: DegT/DnrJ/EryC1/StrS family aminotransferase [Wenzhouxiangellaceae bacterium]